MARRNRQQETPPAVLFVAGVVGLAAVAGLVYALSGGSPAAPPAGVYEPNVQATADDPQRTANLNTPAWLLSVRPTRLPELQTWADAWVAARAADAHPVPTADATAARLREWIGRSDLTAVECFDMATLLLDGHDLPAAEVWANVGIARAEREASGKTPGDASVRPLLDAIDAAAPPLRAGGARNIYLLERLAKLSTTFGRTAPWFHRPEQAATVPATTRRDLPAAELLVRAGSACEWTARSRMLLRNTGKGTRTYADGKTETRSGSLTVRFFQDGNDHLFLDKVNDDGTGTLKILLTPGRRIYWGGSAIQYTESPIAIRQAEPLDRAMPMFGWFLNGVVPDPAFTGSNFFSIREAAADVYRPKIIGSEVVNGIHAIIVEAIMNDSVLRVWVAPERDYNFVKYTYARPGIAPTLPSPLEISVYDVVLRQIAGSRWAIVAGTFRLRTVADPKETSPSLDSELTATRSEIDTEPIFQADSGPWDTSWIEEGTRVVVVTDPTAHQLKAATQPVGTETRYVWKNNGPTPDAGPEPVD